MEKIISVGCLGLEIEAKSFLKISDVSQNLPKKSQNLSQILSQNKSQKLSQNISQNVSQNLSQNLSHLKTYHKIYLINSQKVI